MRQTRRRRVLPAQVQAALRLVPKRSSLTSTVEMIGDPPTFDDPPCAKMSTEVFYPDDARETVDAEVRKACGSCPYQTACMIWALRNEAYGHWCLSMTERAALGGRSARRYHRSPVEAAEEAVRNGVDPDCLAAALREVHAGGATAATGQPQRAAG